MTGREREMGGEREGERKKRQPGGSRRAEDEHGLWRW